MSSLHNVSAIFRSPEAAVLASQAVQAADLAARQGQANLQRDAARRETQVQATSEPQTSAAIEGRSQPPDQEQQRRRRLKTAPSAASAAPEAAPPRGRLDILA